jgi:hypothetical protein
VDRADTGPDGGRPAPLETPYRNVMIGLPCIATRGLHRNDAASPFDAGKRSIVPHPGRHAEERPWT